MIKKLSAAIIGTALIFQALPAFAARTFTDLGENHWAYSVVNTLVEEGTINGYEDGSFKPTNTVTRAEFVKMIGIASEATVEFSDVSPDHWAYEYISHTELEASYDDVFEPGRAITRGETLPVLWIRAGKPAVSNIPDSITAQANGKNVSAVQWGYGYGVMVGDDGVNLRLNDTLTRAEAAALIIKARSCKEQINPPAQDSNKKMDFYEHVYSSMAMFDTPYEASGTITNGELARAVVRLASAENTPTYRTFSFSPANFEHKYAKDLAAVAPFSVGKENITAAFIDKPATVKDAESMLQVAFTMRLRKSFTEKYNDISDKSAKITKKQLVQMLLAFDKFVGMQFSVTTELNEYENYIVNNEHINSDFSTYPKNYADYGAIIKGIPSEVYEAEFIGDKKPVDTHTFAIDFYTLFAGKCKQIEEIAQTKYGADIDVVLYPSLVYDTGSSYAARIKCTVNSVKAPTAATTLFKTVLYGNTDSLKAGDIFFAEIDFGTYAIFE